LGDFMPPKFGSDLSCGDRRPSAGEATCVLPTLGVLRPPDNNKGVRGVTSSKPHRLSSSMLLRFFCMALSSNEELLLSACGEELDAVEGLVEQVSKSSLGFRLSKLMINPNFDFDRADLGEQASGSVKLLRLLNFICSAKLVPPFFTSFRPIGNGET